jgi:lipopolysaccharide biosynthesis regulator YciM
MARSELAGWPASAASGTYPSVTDVEVRRLLLRAIELDPNNPTAQYRLGSLALVGNDFGEAVRRLALAHEQAPDHQGVEKSLGFAYLWAGEEQKGIQLLSHFPEAQTELRFYAELWRRQGESELSRRAWRASMLLKSAPSGRLLSSQFSRLSLAASVTDPGAD